MPKEPSPEMIKLAQQAQQNIEDQNRAAHQAHKRQGEINQDNYQRTKQLVHGSKSRE